MGEVEGVSSEDRVVFSAVSEEETTYRQGGTAEVRRQGFLKVYHAFRDKALRELKGAPLSVLLCIGLHAGKDGKAWPSLDTIADETGYDRKTVQRAIRTLVSRGFVSKVQRRLPEGVFRSNLYRLTLGSTGEVSGQGVGAQTPYGVGAQTPCEVDRDLLKERVTLPSVAAPSLSAVQENPSREKPEASGEGARGDGGDTARPLAAALAEVCGMDLEANRPWLLREAKILARATPPPTSDLIRGRYGVGGWWYRKDWRGKKRELPTPAIVRETWGKWARMRSDSPAIPVEWR